MFCEVCFTTPLSAGDQLRRHKASRCCGDGRLFNCVGLGEEGELCVNPLSLGSSSTESEGVGMATGHAGMSLSTLSLYMSSDNSCVLCESVVFVRLYHF